jgi:hypothetical protein
MEVGVEAEEREVEGVIEGERYSHSEDLNLFWLRRILKFLINSCCRLEEMVVGIPNSVSVNVEEEEGCVCSKDTLIP